MMRTRCHAVLYLYCSVVFLSVGPEIFPQALIQAFCFCAGHLGFDCQASTPSLVITAPQFFLGKWCFSHIHVGSWNSYRIGKGKGLLYRQGRNREKIWFFSHSSHQIPLATVIGSRMGTWPSLDQWESGIGLCLELLGKSSGPGTLRRGLELPTFHCGKSLPGSKANAEEGRAERLKHRGVADGVIWTPGSNRVRSVCCLSRRKSQI